MINPLISIIVPIYNVEAYLKRCIDSILAQTYTNIEIILVNDGSPDNCGIICDEYAGTDTRIKVIHKLNGGLSDARNAGINIATGEYLKFVDSDDFLKKNSIEILYNLISNNNADIAVGQFKYYKTTKDIVLKTKKKSEVILNGENALITMFYQDLFENSAWGKLYRKTLFDKVRFPIGLLYEDLATTHQIIRKANKVAITNEIIYYYFIREDSIMGEKFSKKKLDVLYIGDTLINEYKFAKQEIQLALKCRLTSIYFNISLRMEHSKYRMLFWKRIKKYRWGVLTDTNARKKTKIACFISYFGLSSVSLFFNIIRNR